MEHNQPHQGASSEDMETGILRQFSFELSRMFPGNRIAPLPILRGANDGPPDDYGLTPVEEALRLYMAVVADFYLFSCRGGGWLVPEPLYRLAKGGWGVKIEDFLSVGSFHIGIAWVESGRSVFEPHFQQFLKSNGPAPCKR